jgi:hypothetical protein
MLDNADVRMTMDYTHCGSSRTVKTAKSHLISELLGSDGNSDKSGMFFAFIDNTTITHINWTNSVQLIPC